jgi:hypothetical protein
MEQDEGLPEAALVPPECTLAGQAENKACRYLRQEWRQLRWLLHSVLRDQHFAGGQLGRGLAVQRHLCRDLALIEIGEDDVQCSQEGRLVQINRRSAFRVKSSVPHFMLGPSSPGSYGPI